MERTGHRSKDGVRVYKRSSTNQHKMLSRVLNRETEKSHILVLPLAFSSEKENYPEASKQFHTPTNSTNPVSLRCTSTY